MYFKVILLAVLVNIPIFTLNLPAAYMHVGPLFFAAFFIFENLLDTENSYFKLPAQHSHQRVWHL